MRSTYIHVERVPGERRRGSLLLPLNLFLFLDRQFRQILIVKFVCLLGRSRKDMHQTTLEVLPIQSLVGLDGRFRVHILDVSKPLTGADSSIKGNVNLNKSAMSTKVKPFNETNEGLIALQTPRSIY